MHLSLFLIALLAAAFLAPAFTRWIRGTHKVRDRAIHGFLAANIAEGSREFSSLIPDATIPARYLLAKRGSDAEHFTLAGVGDRPIGVCEDQSTTEGFPLTGLPFRVALLGCGARTMKVAVNSTVNQDDLLVADASGCAKTLPAPITNTPTTYWIIGSAQEAGAASGVTATPTLVEFIGCLPYQLTH